MQKQGSKNSPTEGIKILVIDNCSPYLETVIKLGDANKETLGFLPHKAFGDKAKSGNIFIAIDSECFCAGYVLFGYSKRYNRHTLVHLCISESHRGKGIAKLLVDYLKKITKESRGIGLHCRRDYDLKDMWSKLGFVPQHDKKGRSKEGKLLTYWWFDHGHQDLFSFATNQKLESKFCAVIDHQIFFEISKSQENDFPDSKSLFADWVQSEIELFVTDEIYTQINSIKEDKERKRLRDFAKENFTVLPPCNNSFESFIQSLKIFFDKSQVCIDESEIRNLAKTIASQTQAFVTLNQDLLELKEKIYEEFRLSIYSPNDLISKPEDLIRESDYQPVRLAGTTQLEKIIVEKTQVDLLEEHFLCDKDGETKAEFQQQVRRFLGDKENFECLVVREEENQIFLAFIVYSRLKHELEIPMFRVAKNNFLSADLARHLLFQSISRSARQGCHLTRITDPYLQETVRNAIHENRFTQVNKSFLKLNLAVAETASQLAERLTALAFTLGKDYKFILQLANNFNTENILTNIEALAHIERILWPAKIIDAEIPNFILPIQPDWAAQLFDENLANQTLLGRKTELAFNCESVFYRSTKNSRGLNRNARLLWYVSGTQKAGKGKGYLDVQSIRACSYVDEVVLGKPKELYQSFQQLGVYKWEQLSQIKTDKNGNIMAIKFSHTELFNTPISVEKIEKFLQTKFSLYCPIKISSEVFTKLYNLGMGCLD